MRRADKNILLAVFNTAVEEICQQGNRIAIRTNMAKESKSDSFVQRSWDRYFTDISFGSYRPANKNGRRIGRERAWHFLFKNLALMERIFNSSEIEVRILDIGCSSGYLRRFIEGNYSSNEAKQIYYWGIDIREDKICDATVNTRKIESGASGNLTPSAFVIHDVGESLPFKADSFNFIIIFETIKYLPIKQGRNLISEVKRVLKKRGTFVFSIPTSYQYYREKRPDYMISLSPNQTIELLEDEGFDMKTVFGSQTAFKFLEQQILDKHKPVFSELSEYYPPEIVAAIFAPLYPEYCTQITFYAYG